MQSRNKIIVPKSIEPRRSPDVLAASDGASEYIINVQEDGHPPSGLRPALKVIKWTVGANGLPMRELQHGEKEEATLYLRTLAVARYDDGFRA